YKIDQWRKVQQQQYDMSLRVMKLDQKQNAGFMAIGQARNLFIMCWIALLVVDGRMTLGMMMSVSVIIGMVTGPLGQLVDFLRRVQDARISLERSDEVRMADDEDSPGMITVEPSHPMDIELRGVTFAYGGRLGKPAVSDITFTIPAGSFVAIVGESGSGKTTLMKLLLKFYEPQKGQILLGGRQIADYSAASLRSACGIVSQDNFLFSDTMERNIVLGGEYDAERLAEAVDTACLADVAKARPLGLHTKIGAEGEGLSGGERQRVMMARVAYKRPPYIMLDEATSNLDAHTEQRITDNIARRFAGATRIVIAHRLSTVRDADLIIVMRAGRVVETGTHQSLVDARGYYYELIHNQLDLPAV
ncbi:MAG: ATP-binding cassette domain-containing protein, partial [Paramuribaculum sp.]|nr:ATP-binding cassette domain-containing protein [Paramuribaculum sp.]